MSYLATNYLLFFLDRLPGDPGCTTIFGTSICLWNGLGLPSESVNSHSVNDSLTFRSESKSESSSSDDSIEILEQYYHFLISWSTS